jgi:hypothetical protein
VIKSTPYEITPSAGRALLQNRPPEKLGLYARAMAIYLAYAALMMALYFLIDARAPWATTYFVLYGIIPSFFGIVLFLTRDVFIGLTRNFAPTQNRGPITFACDEGGLYISSPNSELHLRWPGVQTFSETKDFILFFVNPRIAHIVPKSALSDAVPQIEQIKSWMSAAPKT